MSFENLPSSPNSPKEKPQSDMTRRSFLRGLGAIAFAATTGSIIEKGGVKPLEEIEKIKSGKTLDDYKRDVTEIINESELETSIEELRSNIRQLYGINVELTQTEINELSIRHYGLTNELRLTKKLEALEILSEELAKYPIFVISQSGLKNITLTERPNTSNVVGYSTNNHLEAVDREQQPGLALAYDWNSGADTPEKDREQLDEITKGLTREDKEAFKKGRASYLFSETVHHELAHFFIDVPGTEATPKYEEEKVIIDWHNLFADQNYNMRTLFKHEAEVKMPSGEIKYHYENIPSYVPGFASNYGLTNSEEDRATIAEKLMKGTYLDEDIANNNDEILMSKVQKLKEYYYNLSLGLMDESYWQYLRFGVHEEESGKLIPVQIYTNDKAKDIVSTPYQNYSLRHKVSEDTYKTWQLKLANIYHFQ